MDVAIMQPCYLPWRGYFALMNLAHVFVHLDHVPLPQGRSVQSRIAIKTAQGRQWLSLPVRHKSSQRICDAQLAVDRWRRKHAMTLLQHYPKAFQHVAEIYDRPWTHLAELNITLAQRLSQALDVTRPTLRSSQMDVPGCGSDLILNLCRTLGATRYFTGHGARNYLDHDAFDRCGIEVLYLDYDLSPYPQPHGEFDPHVSVLDVIEHAAVPSQHIRASLVPWQQFMAQAA